MDREEQMLAKLLNGLSQKVYVQSINSTTGAEQDLKPQIEDQEAIIVIKGEWDREDVKDVLKSLLAD